MSDGDGAPHPLTSDDEHAHLSTLGPWTCQNCTTKNEHDAQCCFCATYHLDASELNPLVTRLAQEPCPQLHGVTNARERQHMFHASIPMNSSDDDTGSNGNSPRYPMPTSNSITCSHSSHKSHRDRTKSNRLRGFALPITGYVYERECEKHRNFAQNSSLLSTYITPDGRRVSTNLQQESSASLDKHEKKEKKERGSGSGSGLGSGSGSDHSGTSPAGSAAGSYASKKDWVDVATDGQRILTDGDASDSGAGFDSDKSEDDSESDDEMHPERPGRTRAIHSRLKAQGLLDRMEKIPSREARFDEVLTIHTKNHVAGIMQVSKELTKRAERENKTHCHVTSAGDTYYSQDTAKAALLSAGCMLNAVDKVVRGECQNAIANVRPPGHHAECDQVMGFCFFNNVAVAAKVALDKYEGVNRILIVDWDVHHGNATEHQFDENPNVLYISLHRYDESHFYPGTGHPHSVGSGLGRGYNINIGWNGPGAGDAEYLAAFHQLVMPIGHAFNPDLVFVSAGFDSAKGDPLGGCRVSPSGFAHMTAMLSSLARGRMVVCLEGGYNLRSISRSMEACARVLLGDGPLPSLTSTKPKSRMMQSIARTIMVHTSFWQDVLFPFVTMKRDREEAQQMKERLLLKIQSSERQINNLLIVQSRARRDLLELEREKKNIQQEKMLLEEQHVRLQQRGDGFGFAMNVGGRDVEVRSRWAQRRARAYYRTEGGGGGGEGGDGGDGGRGQHKKRRRRSVEDVESTWGIPNMSDR